MMGLLWIMVCYLSLASSSSQAKPEGMLYSYSYLKWIVFLRHNIIYQIRHLCICILSFI